MASATCYHTHTHTQAFEVELAGLLELAPGSVAITCSYGYTDVGSRRRRLQQSAPSADPCVSPRMSVTAAFTLSADEPVLEWISASQGTLFATYGSDRICIGSSDTYAKVDVKVSDSPVNAHACMSALRGGLSSIFVFVCVCGTCVVCVCVLEHLSPSPAEGREDM